LCVRFAALHRRGRELGLRLVAADDEHEEVLAVRLVVGHVHESPRHARGERDHVVGVEVHILERVALVPFATPLSRHRNEGLVRVVVVHERALAWLCLAVAEVEAFGDGDRGLGGGIRADGGVSRLRGLEAEHVEQSPPALGQRTVGQAAIGALQLLEARDARHHFVTTPAADVFPVAHARLRI